MPTHLRPSGLLWVFLGGVAGTGARALMLEWFPNGQDLHWAVLGINLLGAFLLGILLQALLSRGLSAGGWLQLRLLFGTGALGGFTTYSALSEGIIALTASGDPLGAALYGFGTVVLGAGATWAGIAVSSVRRGTRSQAAGSGADEDVSDA